MVPNALTLAGLLIVLGVFAGYFGMIFVLHRFTYRTRVFHAAVLVAMALAVTGVALGGSLVPGVLVLVLGAAWFIVTRRELGIHGSRAISVRVGDPMPALTATTIDGTRITERELAQAAPALLVLYRGWWCPSSKVQLDDLRSHYEELAALGVRLYAGSVDGAEESAPMQEHVGSAITILCSVDVAFLDAIGVRDQRGAPWYDRLLFGAANQPIAMPSAIGLGPNGRITFAERSTRVDDRPSPVGLIASMTATMSKAGAG